MGVYGDGGGLRLGFVYFAQVQEPPGQPIKIGWSRNPASRVHELSAGSPIGELVIAKVVRGTLADERRFHGWFAHLRIRREWFRAEASLCDFINELQDERGT